MLADGVDVNSRMTIYDRDLFADKWLLGYSPLGSENWTPLLAALNSHREPPPMMPTENTVRAIEAATAKMREIDPRLILERDERRRKIAKRLIAEGAGLDLDDGYGKTALAAATPRDEEVALLLIESGAKINTSTKCYIDGPCDITPVHSATASLKILEAMLKRGGKVDAVDSRGETQAFHSN